MKSIVKIFLFLKDYLKYYKWILVLQMIFSLIAGFGSVAGIVALQFAIQSIKDNNFLLTTIICASIIGYYFFSAFVNYFHYFVNTIMSQKISKKIRNDLFIKLNKLKISYFDKNPVGETMSKFVNDVNNISIFLSDNFADVIGLLVWVTGIGIALIVVSWQMALIIFAMFLITIIVVGIRIKKSLPYFNKFQNTLGEYTSFLEEKIAGQFVVDLFEQQNIVKQEFDVVHKKVSDLWQKAQLYSFYSYPIIDFCTNLITVLITSIGTIFVLTDVNFLNFGNVENQKVTAIAALTIILLMSRNFLGTLNQLPSIIHIILGAQAGVERINEVFKQEDEMTNGEKLFISLALSINKRNQKTSDDELIIKPNIEFKNVNFTYDGKNKVLKNVSFKIKSGQFIGIVGPTGSGKSTIINLITKLYEISSGEILLDGVNLKKINRDSLRKNISIVLQDTFFFSLSIRENLKLGKPNATDEEIIIACKKANCHELISSLPNGYDTIISNFTSQLSKGQRQLIAIARAIISESNLVIFDEATSSVDIKTEIELQEAMSYLLKEKTAILIAHRLSTIRDADKILVINKGELLEEGNHESLLKQNGFYAKLYNSQFDEID